MNELVTLLKGLPTWSYFVVGLILFYLLSFIFYSKYSKNRKKTLMNQNPDAALVYCGTTQSGIKTVAINIHTIDGVKHADWFNEGLNLVYSVTAGTHTIEASATTSRPGILHKTVNEIFGPAKLEVEVEPRKKYALGFNTKEKEFTFTEIQQ